jgi:tetratricopeptide (TPR) repeat protein
MDDLGEYDTAMSYYIDAIEIRRNRHGLDDVAVEETLYSMGQTLHNMEEAERALVCFEESLSMRRYQLGEDSKEVGDGLNMMNLLKAKKGELNVAFPILWDSLRIRKLQNDHTKVSETLKNIGIVHREKHELDLAVECHEECLRMRRIELGTAHDKVDDALIAIGEVESDMQHTDDAMRSYQEALKIRTLIFAEHDESDVALKFRANNYSKSRDLLSEFVRIRCDNCRSGCRTDLV